MPKWIFWRSRLKGIWRLLTCRYFVVMTSNEDASKVRGHYNVSHPSFRRLARLLDAAIEQNEAGDGLMKDVNEILNKP